jgi:hypothetical protein
MKSNQSKIKEPKIYKSVEEASNAKHEAAKETVRRIGIEKIAALK